MIILYSCHFSWFFFFFLPTLIEHMCSSMPPPNICLFVAIPSATSFKLDDRELKIICVEVVNFFFFLGRYLAMMINFY